MHLVVNLSNVLHLHIKEGSMCWCSAFCWLKLQSSTVLFSRLNRWTRPDIAPTSGMANVIVGIPTGYVISRDTIEWMYSANITGLQRVSFYAQKLITFFSHVSLTKCVPLYGGVGWLLFFTLLTGANFRPNHSTSNVVCLSVCLWRP